MKKAIAIIAAALLMAGCQSAQVERQVAFPEDEYAKLEKSGDSVIEGQLFLKTRGGDVKLGAGNEVIATPVTTYTEETTRIYRQNKQPLYTDPRAKEYTHRTIADGEGRFKLTGLPEGNFFVAGAVAWEVGPYSSTQGDIIIKRVYVKEGETKKVMLTK